MMHRLSLKEALFQSIILCALAGALASSTRLASTFIVDTLAGMDSAVVIQHAILQTTGNIIFGTVGALGVPSVIRKLKAFGAIES